MLFTITLFSSIYIIFAYNCSGITIRKEVRQMKADGDWDGFVKAFKTLNTNGVLQKYVELHSANPDGYWSYAHGTQNFLVWHRVYLKVFLISLSGI